MCEAERAWEARVKNSGVEEGMELGVEQGALEERTKIVHTLSKSMNIEQIADILGKTSDEIENILKN